MVLDKVGYALNIKSLVEVNKYFVGELSIIFYKIYTRNPIMTYDGFFRQSCELV